MKLPQSALATITLLAASMVPYVNFSPEAQAGTITVMRTAESIMQEDAALKLQEFAVKNQARKMTALGAHDVSILIDRSASMQTVDCPISLLTGLGLSASSSSQHQSRWLWCCEQTQQLTGQTKVVLENGVRVVVFSNLPKVYNHVKIEHVSQIFKGNTPSGSTNVALALSRQLSDYFKRRTCPDEGGTAIKPLLIAVITDACFENSIHIQRIIAAATKRMISADEITIVFLQVGQDAKANETLKALGAGSRVRSDKASFDIVRTTPFSELRTVGLTDALLEAVAADPLKDHISRIPVLM